MSKFDDNIVNQNFRKVFEALEGAGIIKTKAELAKSLGTYNHIISHILDGKRNITLDQTNRLVENYDIDANFLFGLTDDIFRHGLGRAQSDDGLKAYSKSDMLNGGQQANITLVPERALAGYILDHSQDVSDLSRFSIPNMHGDLIAFEIEGDSMMPTITNGDYVICEELDRGTSIRENQIYVVVSNGVAAKRVQTIRDNNEITGLKLISDNDRFKPYDVDIKEVQRILKVKCRITNYAIN